MLKRTLVLGNKGPDVKDAQYVLTFGRFGNFHPGPGDGIFGQQMAAAVKRAKFSLGYSNKYVIPIFGNKLYSYLLPRGHKGWRPLPLSYQARRVARLKAAKVTKRKLVCDYARWGVSHEPQISYAQVRPIPSNPWHLPMATDCSGIATLAYHAAGALDAIGSDGTSGNTDTLSAHGKHVTVAQLRPADLVFYDHPDHVGIYMGGGHVIEHGSSAGPRWEPVYYRPVSHCRSYLP
jgi:hypothetical protein